MAEAESAISFLMENLEELMISKRDLISEVKDQIERLYKDLRFFQEVLLEFSELDEVQNLKARIGNLAHDAEYTVDLFVVNSIMTKKNMMMMPKKDRSLNLDHVKKEIAAIKTEVKEMYDKKIYKKGKGKGKGMANIQVGSSRANTITCTWDEEIMVGFKDEAMSLKEKLTRGPNQLMVISIVGMAGLGKTTLAKNLYNDPLVVYHFHIRGWISVSQGYQKRDLLLGLLSFVMQHKNEINQMKDDDKLGEQLHKGLKGRRYFIVMDDIWNGKAWDDLKNLFPNDNNGSRIMFTSRHREVAVHAKRSIPISLRFLRDDESWDLFRQKVFGRGESCPPKFTEIGKQIVKRCQGLPLAIVVVAGMLVNEGKSLEVWNHAKETLNSQMDVDPQLWMKTLSLGYNQLPHHLKPCFLYFGTFPEDFEIPVRKLIWLWIAEGFIRKTAGKCLEDVAEEYLMDLIDRSLVLVSRRGYNGKIKACSIHDLLHDYCLRKVDEEYFLQRISNIQHLPSSSKICFERMRRIGIDTDNLKAMSEINSFSGIRSLLSFKRHHYRECHLESLPLRFQLLRVFEDVIPISICSQYRWVNELVLLRYLSLQNFQPYSLFIPISISNLWNLETLILSSESSITLPQSIRKMEKLRHLHFVGGGRYEIESQDPYDCYPFSLDNLQTLSWVDPQSCSDFLGGTHNLKRLGFQGHVEWGGCLTFPRLDSLNNLEELRLFNTIWYLDTGIRSNNLGGIKFPTNLKKLTLKKTYLDWDEMSILSKLLPNLECLKLLEKACNGQSWETSRDFSGLKFLKLASLNLVWWNASSNHFPSLQQLVISKCHCLAKIPSEMGNIPTLQMIEVDWCNNSLANSAREIKEEQESLGNNWLQIIQSYNQF
ncbi:hypothetical protein ACSBR1_040088 [Camellia fascicularis]